MAIKNDTGKSGEETARTYLEAKGYKILDTNWHFHHYEIDIVAVDGDSLAVIEVKTRSHNYLVAPEQAVDARKIRRIVTAADAYVRQKNIDLKVRFDIICLIKKDDAYNVENHLIGAFVTPLFYKKSSYGKNSNRFYY
jgi:putative endonuclease